MADDADKPSSEEGPDKWEEEDSTRFIDAGAAAAIVPPNPGAGSTFSPGSLLSHTYRIEKLLARGGMGEIYRAQHAELQTWHAIKIILPDLADDPKIVDLFRREAGVLRTIRHEAIVAYDGVFRDENGRVFLVMEFVDGPSLAEVLKQRKLSPDEVETLKNRLASGLAAVHESGVVHRDMSPDNIILPDERVEAAKIIDFGIAKLEDPQQATIIGDDFAGKYSYVSPEQLGLYDGEVDARSDIYSLGLILAATANGKALDMGGSPASVLEARKSVPDLSFVPVELLDDISAMLQPDPARRPQSMREIISGRGRETAPPVKDRASIPDPKKSADRGRTPIVLAALASVVILAAAGYGGYAVFLVPKDPGTTGSGEVAGAIVPPEPATTDGGGTSITQPGDGTAPTEGPSVPSPEADPLDVLDQANTEETGTEIADNKPVPIPLPPTEPVSPEPTSEPTTPALTTGTKVIGTEIQSLTPAAPESTIEPNLQGPDQATTEDLPDTVAKSEGDVDQQTAEVPRIPAPTDPQLRRSAVRSIMNEVQCGRIGGSFVGNSDVLRLSGHVPSNVERQILKVRLLAVPGVSSVEDAPLVKLPEPQCKLVEELPKTGLPLAPELAAEAPALGQAAQAGTLSFKAGQFLKLDIVGPDYPTFFYVDYFDAANNVIHLFPSPVAQNNSLQPQQNVSIGGTDRYAIGPPYGTDLVVAIGSSVPLFDQQRPEVEAADKYFADVKAALSAARNKAGFRGEYSYIFVETSP